MKTLKSYAILLFAAAMVFAKAPAPIESGLGKVYDGYLKIQQALADDDFQKAKTASASLVDTVKAVPTKGLDKNAKSHWDSSSVGISKSLKAMADAKDIKALRKEFKGLTPLVVSAVESFGMKSGSSAYLIHCPMANADWVQKDKKTMNPYYGKEMQECGEVVREVKKR